MFGLLFIISSAVLPTFFLVYSVVGKSVLRQETDESQITLAMLVVFPLISILIMLVSKSTMPRSALGRRSGLDVRLLMPGMLFLGGFFLHVEIIAFIAGSLAGAFFILSSYQEEKRQEQIEERMPDALFSVGSLPKSARASQVFEIIEKGGHGALSEEAAKSGKQLSMNVSMESVLDDLWKRNSSGMLKRACRMMKQMVQTNSLDRMSILAEDIIRAFQIARERSQVFALQKYTLIFGSFLIALIMNMTIKLMGSMGELMGESGTMVSAAESLAPPYLVIYSVIAAAAIADAEGKKSSMSIYFLVLSLLGLLTFYFITL
jgi:hypothetical protein